MNDLVTAARAVVDGYVQGCEFDIDYANKMAALEMALAAHADDGERITREWFESSYQCGVMSVGRLQIFFDGSDLLIEGQQLNVRTRGDLRTLLKLLGGEG